MQLPKQQLPKSVLAAALGSQPVLAAALGSPAHPSHSARPAEPRGLNLTFGKLPLGKLHIWEVATWKIANWESALGKMPLWKYLTPLYVHCRCVNLHSRCVQLHRRCVQVHRRCVHVHRGFVPNSSFITGEVTVAKILDREEKSSYSIIVQEYIIQII